MFRKDIDSISRRSQKISITIGIEGGYITNHTFVVDKMYGSSYPHFITLDLQRTGYCKGPTHIEDMISYLHDIITTYPTHIYMICLILPMNGGIRSKSTKIG
ncbi:hypothetical protein CEXT_550201 [Caerostris extrusa]|uniref:Uncharacterized protein n=1 Tax=Caerostris extrusa TaxID=172846 RepID=A0AAV4XKM0_CAEEX|nr:hypothetical protein CEXT_550201 [Caerostris extrusa]